MKTDPTEKIVVSGYKDIRMMHELGIASDKDFEEAKDIFIAYFEDKFETTTYTEGQ